MYQTRQEKGAYYHTISVSVHAGYVWSKQANYGIAAISDCSDHKAAATWASMGSFFEELVTNGIKQLIVVSDSPTSQYRNKTNMFLMHAFSQKCNPPIELKWIYLEAGHGKGTADGIGAVVKRAITDNISFQPDNSIINAEQVIKIIADKTNVHLKLYDQSLVAEFEATVPPLQTVSGTSKLHEIIIKTDGSVFGRNLSDDPEFQLKLCVKKCFNLELKTTNTKATLPEKVSLSKKMYHREA